MAQLPFAPENEAKVAGYPSSCLQRHWKPTVCVCMDSWHWMLSGKEPRLGTYHPANLKFTSHLLLRPGSTANLFSQMGLAKMPASCTKLQITGNPYPKFFGPLEYVKKGDSYFRKEPSAITGPCHFDQSSTYMPGTGEAVVPGWGWPVFSPQKAFLVWRDSPCPKL